MAVRPMYIEGSWEVSFLYVGSVLYHASSVSNLINVIELEPPEQL